ncbi:hypothetical protein KEM55_008305 [Ascosphaera atra]|nr:hypothetical protein KEM55_008305 [Ascosphaera atra]
MGFEDSTDTTFLTTSLVPERSDNPVPVPSTTEISFDGLLADPLQIKQDLRNGCGGQTWPAGMVLSKYMLRMNRHDLIHKSMYCLWYRLWHRLWRHPTSLLFLILTSLLPFYRVELGAGGGLVGLAVARGIHEKLSEQSCGPIYITDQIPMFELMKENVALNELDASVHPVILDWGEPIPADIPSSPDIILAADCVYFEPAFPLLLKTLDDLLGPNTICYFCYKRRRRADLRFVKAAKKKFDMAEVTDDIDRETYKRENIFLYRIRRKSNDIQRTDIAALTPPKTPENKEIEA